jgi:hypothetical protein
MPFFRTLAILLLLSAVILLTGALNSRPAENSQIPSTTEADAAAANLLDQALERLHPQRVTWLETQVWQKARLGRFTYESGGRYLIGPDRRLRLELLTRHGSAQATLLVVSDGAKLWEGQRLDDGDWTDVACLDWQEILQASAQSGLAAPSQTELGSQQAFGGVVPLLQGLRTRLVWTRKEAVRRGGTVYLKLTGHCADQAAYPASGAAEAAGIPPMHECRLYLDSQSLWPHRVEWCGPAGDRTGNTQLLQVEFRNPVLNRPLSAERCRREFTFPTMPALAAPPVPELADQLRARARGLLAQQVSVR